MLLRVAVFAVICGVSYGRLTALEGRAVDEDVRNLRSSKDTFCTNPTLKGKVNFSDKLVGRAKLDFEMYSGYVNVTSAPDYLFYWFFSSRDKNPDAPLIIWTNGGPGCTAMEGATTEIGPLVLFDIKESCSSNVCDYTGQFSTNAHSWNAHANVLFLDQPRNVGYSFGYGSGVKSSVEAAADFITFYNGWLELFPEFVGRKLIIAGESYGGHYVPAWADAILNYNKNSASPINFAGVAIGNGCVNNTVQSTSKYVEFQHAANLIPASSNPGSQAAAQAAMVANIGYTPNYYDYRLQSVSCSACYSYNYTAWSYWFLQPEVEAALNVCGDAGNDAFAGSAGGCVSMGSFDSKDTFDYSGALARTLEAGVPVTLYYGKTDTACNYVGGLEMANTISWKGKDGFAATALTAIETSGAEMGQIKSFGGLTFIQVESAGHMVPLDQPAASAFVIDTLVGPLLSKK